MLQMQVIIAKLLMHEQIAEDKLDEADKALANWKNDHYWNINDQQKSQRCCSSGSRA